MWDWLSGLGSGLSELLGFASEAPVSEIAPFVADPVFSFGVSGAGTDVLGNAVEAGNTFFDSGFTLGVPGIDDIPLRESVFDLSLGGARPLGFLGEGGGLETLAGAPVVPTSFGGFNSNLGVGATPALSNFLDTLRSGADFLRPGTDGVGGGSVNIAAPRFDDPQTAVIPRLSVPGTQPVPAFGNLPTPAPFTPMAAPEGRAAPTRGLEALTRDDTDILPESRRRLQQSALLRALAGEFT